MRRWPLLSVLLLALTLTSAASAERLEIATLAPKKSAWGKVFSAWAQAVNKKTDGKLELRFYWGAVQGTDSAVVAKLRSGQLDGATLGAEGLGEIHRPALALQLPGLFRTWQGIDRATAALYPELAKGFDAEGFFLSSIGDVGRARTLSKGKAVRSPDDLKGMKPFAPITGVIAPVLASELALTPVRLRLPELLPALSSGRVNVISAPALAVEQLQWAPHLDHVGEDVAGIGVGAMVLSKKRLAGIPSDVLDVMRSTGKKAGSLLRERVRKMDDDAFERLRAKMTVVKLSDAERKVWDGVFKKVRQRLGQSAFTPELVKRLEALGG
ncbi:MAG: TRAP transporter substrate-binding protein DctP [Myxococcales bacterium]|nr:TRAP transporter substrate-binding protein DctP [Myxococcales bacterium]